MSGLHLFFRVLIITVFFSITSCGGEPREITATPVNLDGPSSITQSSRNNVATPRLMWSPPRERENGEYLELDEIAGYEIRYQNEQGDYVYLSLDTFVNQLAVTQLTASKLPQNANFEIAVYDTKGRYSDFISIQPHQ